MKNEYREQIGQRHGTILSTQGTNNLALRTN